MCLLQKSGLPWCFVALSPLVHNIAAKIPRETCYLQIFTASSLSHIDELSFTPRVIIVTDYELTCWIQHLPHEITPAAWLSLLKL